MRRCLCWVVVASLMGVWCGVGRAGVVSRGGDGGWVLDHPMGHSHNDYEQWYPLELALDSGMLSIEADVHLVGGALYVAHSGSEIESWATLSSLYLDPLWLRFESLGGEDESSAFGGRVRESGEPVLLMIDIKTSAQSTWAAIEAELAGYVGMVQGVSVTRRGETVIDTGPVVVAISGNEPAETITEATVRYSGIDGRYPGDLSSDRPAHLMPMVSVSYGSFVAQAGTSSLVGLRPYVEAFAEAAEAEGRLARIWGAPDDEATWSMLFDAGIQLINTDDPAGLAAFLDERVVLVGDTNGDGVVDGVDVQRLIDRLGSTRQIEGYDLNGNGGVDAGDLDVLIEDVLGTAYGDANLDGAVDLLDLSALASGFGGEGGWAEGDFDGSGLVDLLDLSVLATHFGEGTSVPEPGVGMVVVCGLGLVRRRG